MVQFEVQLWYSPTEIKEAQIKSQAISVSVYVRLHYQSHVLLTEMPNWIKENVITTVKPDTISPHYFPGNTNCTCSSKHGHIFKIQ
jgi:hypothetical protein